MTLDTQQIQKLGTVKCFIFLKSINHISHIKKLILVHGYGGRVTEQGLS